MHIATNEPQPGRLQVVFYVDRDERAHLGSDRLAVTYLSGVFSLRAADAKNGYILRPFGKDFRIRVAPTVIDGMPSILKLKKTEVVGHRLTDRTLVCEAPDGLFEKADEREIDQAFTLVRQTFGLAPRPLRLGRKPVYLETN